MTRFDAADPTERRKLYADAITAHRKRGSGFLTLEADDAALDSDLGTPWLQFADGTINLDCTDDELEALKSLLEEFPAFTIDEIHRQDDVDGVNVRVSARADPNRISQCLDAIFRRVYGLPSEFRVWVVEI